MSRGATLTALLAVVLVTVPMMSAGLTTATGAVASPNVVAGDATIDEGEEVTVPVTLSAAPAGLSGFNLTVRAPGERAEVTDVRVPDEFGLRTQRTTDGVAVAEGVDVRERFRSGAEDVTLAVVTVAGRGKGSASLAVDVRAMDDDNGDAVPLETIDGELSIRPERANDGGDTGTDDGSPAPTAARPTRTAVGTPAGTGTPTPRVTATSEPTPVSEPSPANGPATTPDAVIPVSDWNPDELGVQVPVEDSGTAVTSVTVAEPTAGNVFVADLREAPEGVPAPPEEPLSVVSVEVPEAVADDPGRVQITLDDPPDGIPPESLRVSRYAEESKTWQRLDTAVSRRGTSVVLTGDTPGFSIFAVVVTEPQPTETMPSSTDKPAGTTATATGTSTGAGPGFGAIIALLAFVATAVLAGRRT